jgi:hypothetical protein
VDIGFKFLIRNPLNIHSIRVEFCCTNDKLKMSDTLLPLWSYPNVNTVPIDHGPLPTTSATTNSFSHHVPMHHGHFSLASTTTNSLSNQYGVVPAPFTYPQPAPFLGASSIHEQSVHPINFEPVSQFESAPSVNNTVTLAHSVDPTGPFQTSCPTPFPIGSESPSIAPMFAYGPVHHPYSATAASTTPF